jgi:hypothetical protein
MNTPRAIKLIKEKIAEEKRLDVRQLFYALHPEGWAEVFDITPDEWKAYRKAGIYVMNPYFELLEALVEAGELVESIDPRPEGGNVVPRFSYTLA